jgi:hypothetical protein
MGVGVREVQQLAAAGGPMREMSAAQGIRIFERLPSAARALFGFVVWP